MNFAEKEQREATYPDVPYDLFLMFLRQDTTVKRFDFLLPLQLF